MRNLLSFEPNVLISSFSDSSSQDVILMPIYSHLPIIDGTLSLLEWMDIDSINLMCEQGDDKNDDEFEDGHFQSNKIVFSY